MLKVKKKSCEYKLLKSFGLLDEGIETISTDYEVNALNTTRSADKSCHAFSFIFIFRLRLNRGIILQKWSYGTEDLCSVA